MRARAVAPADNARDPYNSSQYKVDRLFAKNYLRAAAKESISGRERGRPWLNQYYLTINHYFLSPLIGPLLLDRWRMNYMYYLPECTFSSQLHTNWHLLRKSGMHRREIVIQAWLGLSMTNDLLRFLSSLAIRCFVWSALIATRARVNFAMNIKPAISA